MPTIKFTVPGIPISKGRPRLGKHGAFTPPKTKLYETKGRYHARNAMNGKNPIDCCVGVDLLIYMPIPKSFSKKDCEAALNGSKRPIGKSDVDNISKAALDFCNNIVYVDDNQVCDLSASKFYSDNPRMEVKVSWDE